MANPVIVTNTLTPPSVQPGGSSTWRTVAQDPDARSCSLTREVEDGAGNTISFQATLIVADPLTYAAPTSPDPKVHFVVDAADPTIVHISVDA